MITRVGRLRRAKDVRLLPCARVTQSSGIAPPDSAEALWRSPTKSTASAPAPARLAACSFGWQLAAVTNATAPVSAPAAIALQASPPAGIESGPSIAFPSDEDPGEGTAGTDRFPTRTVAEAVA